MLVNVISKSGGTAETMAQYLALETLQQVLALPARDDVSFPIQEQLIVELYSK